MVLFEGDRAAVFLQRDGRQRGRRGQPRPVDRLPASIRDIQPRSLPAAAIAARRPLFAVDYRDDPRGEDVRAAVVQEGFDTMCTAPLIDGTELLGMLNVYHDPPHPWTADELETIAAARDPGQRRHPGRPELPADGDLDGPAPVDPAARRAAQPPVERAPRSAWRSPPSCAS